MKNYILLYILSKSLKHLELDPVRQQERLVGHSDQTLHFYSRLIRYHERFY